ncbi:MULTISPECIES: hypothetical protein [unclassified Fusibacter]|uniref:Ppx/GppA phosphatase family protein n=1 Tax=unclassified Fusibacter TaxID=2624464 RepID=UPI0013E9393B|nr:MULTISPECIES: hypothetical protein [unclassified Fusibacter]MCK8061447.1 hypothetical protein [Fusibacter sp. A2]NPE23634.1 hypothetical protein [Fusibacter sp. A1]
MSIFAAIDIGSHAIKIKIVEHKKTGYKLLENIIHPLALGISVLHSGKINRTEREELIDCLIYFKKLMSEYDVDRYKAVATGAFREARNGRFVVELIGKRAKLQIEIVEEPIERFLTYLSLKEHLPHYKKMRKEGVLLVEVGSNSSEVIVYKENKMVRNNEIHIGTLRLKELIRTINRETIHVPQILEDYVYAATENLQSYLIRKQINHFVIVGSDVKRAHLLMGDHQDGFTPQAFLNFVDDLYHQDKALKMRIEDEHMDYEEMLAAMSVFNQFFKHTTCELVYVPDISLRDGMIIALNENIDNYSRNHSYTRDIIAAAKQIAKRHHSTINHVTHVDKNAVMIFDAYQKEESFTEKDLLLLRLAAILHETGKFSRQTNYYAATYQSITHATLLGVTQQMLLEVAEIAMQFFYFNGDMANTDDLNHTQATTKHTKLGLILALADATDKSKKQSILLKKAVLEKNRLKMTMKIYHKHFFETWAINYLSETVADIFGHEIVLKDVE